MRLRHRPMRLEDVAECVEIIANHPVIGPRYGPAIEHLPEAWLRLLQFDALNTAVVLAGEGSRAPICFFGVSAIVRDDFLREMKTPPHFWLGPELTRRIMMGESPLLTGKQLREANSRGGLNMVCWEAGFRPEYEANSEAQRYMMSSFIQMHRGYLWKEAISAQSWSPDHLDFILKTGGYLWDPLAGGYTSTLRTDPSEIVSKPHIVGITRDLELKRQGDWAGSWVGALFDYHLPRIFFSRSEQRLLLSALLHKTDEELCVDLGVSASAVKNTWRSIYNRAASELPELFPEHTGADGQSSERGKEKRRRLLAYIDEHPEELRPVSRKLVQQAALESSQAV